LADEPNQLVIVRIERRVEGRVAYVTARIEKQVSGAREAYAGSLPDAASAGVRVYSALNEMVEGAASRLLPAGHPRGGGDPVGRLP
jgi:hypothetical protein